MLNACEASVSSIDVRIPLYSGLGMLGYWTMARPKISALIWKLSERISRLPINSIT